MKRLLSIIVITYSTPLMAGPWFSRPEPQGIRIEAHLYKVNGKKLTEISKDQDDYYRNGQDEYTRDSVPAQPEDLKSANRITIHSALFDSKKKLATITYYVRIGREATPKKG